MLGSLLTSAVCLIYAAWPGCTTLTISPETTYVTEPLDDEGCVDYETALNQRLGQGITPETNANVLIWKALGPKPEGGEMPADYFRWLGIDPPPPQGDYFVGWDNHLKERLGEDYRRRREEVLNQLGICNKVLWTTDEYPEMASWLDRSEKPLAVIAEATRRPHYFNPLVSKRYDGRPAGLISAPLPTVQKCREIGTALCCRAMLRVRQQKLDDAWSDLITSHRLARLIAAGGTVIESLVGFALETITLHADFAYLEHAKLDARTILTRRGQLRQLPPVPPVADRLDLWDRFVTLDSLMYVARDTRHINDLSRDDFRPPKGNRFVGRMFTRSINWDPAFRRANAIAERCAVIARLPDRKRREEEMAELVAEVRSRARVGLIENLFMEPSARGERIGNLIIGLMLPAVEKVCTAEERVHQMHRNLDIVFALAAFKRDHGRYPDELAALAPKYLDVIPDDLFTGGLLVYRREGDGYALYSLGPDGIDDDGRGSSDTPRGDDVSFRVPVPDPRGKE